MEKKNFGFIFDLVLGLMKEIFVVIEFENCLFLIYKLFVFS